MSIIKFYPFSQETIDLGTPPTPASKNVPKWYRQVSPYAGDEDQFMKSGFSSSTVKRCMPFLDILMAGYILHVPCDIYIDATSNPENIEWSIPEGVKYMKKNLISTHSPEQVNGYPKEDKYHKQVFRIMPFWSVGTEKGYSCLFTHPFHSDPVPFKLFSAIIDTDNFISDGHLSMYIEKDFKGVIEKGTPLAQVIPFKRDDFSMELVDLKTSEKILTKQRLNVRSKFKNGYRNFLRQKKEYR